MVFQLNGVLLDGLVLSVLEKGDAYGYMLTQSLRRTTQISESTLYPVLKRLQVAKFLEAYDYSFQGRTRRYYRITDGGRQRLQMIHEEWVKHKSKIDGLLAEDEESNSTSIGELIEV